MAIVEDGFRLPGAPSECSLKSKARIDALFEDSRSVCSSTIGGWYADVNLPGSGSNMEEISTEEQQRVNNAVQARIEAMFAAVEAETGIPGECAAAILPVRYLGAAPVGGRVASIRGLQEPLRDLLGRLEESLPAELEVSRRGLTFRTSESLEKTSPFRRIAVWSALKLRTKRLPTGGTHHAFVPLVGDDVGSTGDDKHADLYRTMTGFDVVTKSSPPIFAVIMRRPGAARVLECHAFACNVEEDAVAAAATLYRALLADLDANRRRPRQTNGIGCVSLASVVSVGSSLRQSTTFNKSLLGAPPPRPTAPHPVRPPRIKKSSRSSTKDEGNSSSSGQENALVSNCTSIDVKEEDILEGRSRRSSLVPGPILTTAKSLEEKQMKSNVRQEVAKKKVLRESEKNNGNYLAKSIVSTEGVEGVAQPRDNGRQKENYYEFDQSGRNSKQRSPSVARSEDNYERMTRPGSRSDKKQQTDKRIYDTDQSLGGKRPEHCFVQVRGTAKREGSYSVNDDGSEIYGSKRQEYRVVNGSPRNLSKNEIILHGHESVNGARDRRKSNDRTSQKRTKDDYRDPDEILSLDDDPFSETMSAKYVHNSLYEARANGERGTRVFGRASTVEGPSKGNESSNIPEYARPMIRRGSRADSEPPRISTTNEDYESYSRSRRESRLKKSQSDLDLDAGDLMTRVELPRRGSFLNSTSARKPANFQGRTPLGFTELFDEFRNQEGLTSVDDILAAIIDPEGMSFNDLKPLYKEFLLKLASTLTRDELYERSASIMRRRRRPQRGQALRRSCFFGRAIKRSVSRFKAGPTEFTSVIFPAGKLNDSVGSNSSCDAKGNRNSRVLGSRLGRKRSSWRRARHTAGHTTSEDSDTCRRFGRIATANRSSSGYVSCSECSYDSESCTCVSADKCYCSLPRRDRGPPVPVATVVCSCDTDSCSESNKCYCARKLPVRRPTILEQLRQRGIVPAESTLSRTGSPKMARDLRRTTSHASSRSLEFLKVRPRANSSDNLALDYELFSPGKNPRRTSSSGNDKVLVVGARDSQGRLIYVGGTERGKKTCSNGGRRSSDHHEALSIKKSAEIAAVFGNSNKISRRASSVSSFKSSASLEAGLGYLP